MSVIDAKELQDYLPHRYPFLMIDRVIEVEDGKRIVAIKNVSMNEGIFQGHFPGNPVFPGVLMVEAMAQAGAVLAVKAFGPDKNAITYFMSIEKAKFRKPVFPGDQLRLEVEVGRKRGNVWRLSGKAYVGEALVAECDFTAMVTDKEL
jgi:beta-hydroxyacyl-ACP dehydratase FabZ